MIDPLQASLRIAGSGLEAQSARLRIVSENIANAQSTGEGPGSTPYARKTITFENEMDRATGMDLVRVKTVGVDSAPFQVERGRSTVEPSMLDATEETDWIMISPSINRSSSKPGRAPA